ncbi:MAG: hypothetical protein EXR45_04495 [Chloroflexi bacterium]|nr:hypothetical protein [Chloroflexota bacterium]
MTGPGPASESGHVSGDVASPPPPAGGAGGTRHPRVGRRRRASAWRLRWLVRASVLMGIIAVILVATSLGRPLALPAWSGGAKPDASPLLADPSQGTSAVFAVGVVGARRAHLVATGTLPLPRAGTTGPAGYLPAVTHALAVGSPLAWSVWTDIESFGQSAWRDFVQAGRPITHRPPAVDFSREIAVLVWVVPPPGGLPAGLSGTPVSVPTSVRRASGLVLRGAILVDHVAIGLEVAPTAPDQAKPEPLATGLEGVPYALVTIPKDQWPIPPAWGTGNDPVMARFAS